MTSKWMLQAPIPMLFAAGLLGGTASQAAITFANGSDVGWVDQLESSGYKWYNDSGIATDPFVLLTNKHINAIRLRVWVNPEKLSLLGDHGARGFPPGCNRL